MQPLRVINREDAPGDRGRAAGRLKLARRREGRFVRKVILAVLEHPATQGRDRTGRRRWHTKWIEGLKNLCSLRAAYARVGLAEPRDARVRIRPRQFAARLAQSVALAIDMAVIQAMAASGTHPPCRRTGCPVERSSSVGFCAFMMAGQCAHVSRGSTDGAASA
jgi:hypothetical protein